MSTIITYLLLNEKINKYLQEETPFMMLHGNIRKIQSQSSNTHTHKPTTNKHKTQNKHKYQRSRRIYKVTGKNHFAQSKNDAIFVFFSQKYLRSKRFVYYGRDRTTANAGGRALRLNSRQFTWLPANAK